MTTNTRNKEGSDTPEQEPLRTEKRVLPIDWTEAEWFTVWLKLARHEYVGPPQKAPTC